LRIVADSSIARVREAYGDLGDLVLRPGRSINADDVRDADALVIRSTTRVNAELLDGSRVRFVGATVVGTDHMDLEYLNDRGIAHTSAPGSNAVSVREWFAAAVLLTAGRRGWRLGDKTIGVIGVGNVGGRVARLCDALGMRVLRNDPPRARATGDAIYRPIDELFDADIITLHTPLTRTGDDATRHLADAAFFERLKPGVLFVNAARGGVTDTRALADALDRGHVADALLDVWEGEPGIDADLVPNVAVATAHIAGHSYDGKVRGAEMIRTALCDHFNLDPPWDPWPTMPPPPTPTHAVDATGRGDEDVLRDVVLASYDIKADDANLRKIADAAPDQRAAYFDRLRADYPVRREFVATSVRAQGASPGLIRKLDALGFTVTE
jgi:erythronate-4-phosphate dehydrogenase